MIVVLQEFLVFAFEILLENDPADVDVGVLVSEARFLLAVRRVEIRIVVDLAGAIDASVARSGVTGWVRGGGRGRVLAVEPSYGTFGGLFDAAGYAVWSAGGSWRVSNRLELFARVENLFDRDYEEVFGYPALGRGALAGIRVATSR